MSQEPSSVIVVYKEIPGLPGYRVGDDGSVWTCRGRGIGKPRQWTQMKTRKCNGYLRVTFTKDYRNAHRRVAHLVLEAFVGPRPNGMQACHFPDRDGTNNKLSNLRWGTPLDNAADRACHGTTARGDGNGRAKLTDDDVRQIRQMFEKQVGTTAISRQFGVSIPTICAIKRGKTWRHI